MTKGSGYENDDDFYIVRDGQAYKLRLLNTDSNGGKGHEYTIEDQKLNLKIYYLVARDSTLGKWTVIDANGTKRYYGGTYGNQTRPSTSTSSVLLHDCLQITSNYSPTTFNAALDCDAGPVEKWVRWGKTWFVISGEETNQENIELAWHLSRIEDTGGGGNGTELSYFQVVQNVGRGANAKRFSKGAYLYEVKNSSGQ